MSLVTITTVTFNIIKNGRENHLRKCLESVHNQTYQNIEHIIIDGNSTDGTLDLIKEYANKGWITYISEPDGGIYDAMNKGIKLARGKYITFLNSDDYYHGERGVEESVRLLEESHADFSFAPVIIKFKDGTLFSDHPQCSPNISNVFFTMPFCHQTMFTRRDVMIRENMFDTSFKSAADYDFVIRLCLKKYRSIFINYTFVTYLFDGVSSLKQAESLLETSNSWRNNYSPLCKITDKDIEQFCKNVYTGRYYENIPHRLAKKLMTFNQYFNYKEYLKTAKIESGLSKVISHLRKICYTLGFNKIK